MREHALSNLNPFKFIETAFPAVEYGLFWLMDCEKNVNSADVRWHAL